MNGNVVFYCDQCHQMPDTGNAACNCRQGKEMSPPVHCPRGHPHGTARWRKV